MKQVLIAGQCALDHSNISELLSHNFEVQIERAQTHDETLSKCQQNRYDLILINRIYDSDSYSGLKTIQRLCAGAAECPVMLVSNYQDAQESAVRAGAVRGFGKAELGEPATLQTLRDVLG